MSEAWHQHLENLSWWGQIDRMLNREFAAMRRDKTRKKKYGKRSTRIESNT